MEWRPFHLEIETMIEERSQQFRRVRACEKGTVVEELEL